MNDSQDRYRTMLHAIPTMAWSSQPDGSVEFANQRWHDYTGLSDEELRGWGWKVAVHPDDLETVIGKWQALLASRQPGEIEGRVRRFDGEYRWFLFRAEPLRDDLGDIIRWYGTNTDIEERKRAESLLVRAAEEIKKSEAQLRTIIDAIPQFVTALWPDGKTLYANQAVMDYTGLSSEEVMAGGFRTRVFHPEDVERLRAERQAALDRGIPFENEQRARRKDGQYRWLLIQYKPLLNERGEVIRSYATGTDIDDRKQAEERTRQENLALREEIDHSSMLEEIVGSSPPLRKVLTQ